ncbi:lytic transglycosylase domain-containing protein [Alphaproteobacteria bacterium KMM 3653]|uniref:Lytic transglycosylase domain-containing protein n=1 Tax=Harenicola maris TaxID=2841044 RepID=A0AAP2G662_9RHOB|nr:lytic transglycosylase domain-containing protein [Harenicola maris]
MTKIVSVLLAGAILLCPGADSIAWAEEPAPYQDFKFKRIKVGKRPVGKRITVQIDPAEQARALAVVPGDPVTPEVVTPKKKDAPRVAAYEWYWGKVSPKLHDAAPGRIPEAVRALRAGPDGKTVRAPSAAALAKIAKEHGADILTSTIGTEISPALALAVIGIESGGQAKAVSSAGATGVMQLMPDTAKRFGVEDSTVPGQNIKGGVAYLDWLVKHFEQDPILALAGYNAGEGAVKEHGGVPPYAETRDYVPKVLAAWAVARTLCATPPELISDGCVFRLPEG